jgi:hypothetical protein
MERQSEKEFTTRFKWGMLLAWTPLLLFMSPIIHDVKSQDFFKTHGISAFMMNDFCDGFSILGFAAFMVFEVAAVALLSRSFSRRHEEKFRKRLRWGILLVWIPPLLLAPAIWDSVHDLSASSGSGVSGLAAVASNFSDMFAFLGMLAVLISEAVAIVLLSRSFSKGRLLRGFLSVLSLCCIVLTVGLSVFAWILVGGYPWGH